VCKKRNKENKSDAIYYAPAGCCCWCRVRDKFNTAVIFFSARSFCLSLVCAGGQEEGQREQMMVPRRPEGKSRRASERVTLLH
jgi:hypothetical protein